jgi:hypothetical protein
MILIALAAAATVIPTPPTLFVTHTDAIVMAEREFARRAQVEGQWKAFRATAAPDGLMFVPDVQLASKALANAKEPAIPVMWWPGTVAASCDGTMGLSTGPWVRAGSAGFGTFTTVWKKTATGYRWRLDHGRNTPKLVAAGDKPAIIASLCEGASAAGAAARGVAYDRLAASVAAKAGVEGATAFAADAAPDILVQLENAMPARGTANLPKAKFGAALASGHSDDWTLAWASRALIGGDTGAHDLRVWQWRGKDGWKLVVYETIGVK